MSTFELFVATFELFVLLYLAPTLILLAIHNYMSFYKEPGMSIGSYLVFSLMTMLPVLNIIILLFYVMTSVESYVQKTQPFIKLKTWLSKPLPSLKRKS